MERTRERALEEVLTGGREGKGKGKGREEKYSEGSHRFCRSMRELAPAISHSTTWADITCIAETRAMRSMNGVLGFWMFLSVEFL